MHTHLNGKLVANAQWNQAQLIDVHEFVAHAKLFNTKCTHSQIHRSPDWASQFVYWQLTVAQMCAIFVLILPDCDSNRFMCVCDHWPANQLAHLTCNVCLFCLARIPANYTRTIHDIDIWWHMQVVYTVPGISRPTQKCSTHMRCTGLFDIELIIFSTAEVHECTCW